MKSCEFLADNFAFAIVNAEEVIDGLNRNELWESDSAIRKLRGRVSNLDDIPRITNHEEVLASIEEEISQAFKNKKALDEFMINNIKLNMRAIQRALLAESLMTVSACMCGKKR